MINDIINEHIKNKLITIGWLPAIYDNQFSSYISEAPWSTWIKEDTSLLADEFKQTYKSWVKNSNNTVVGLNQFKNDDIIIGTTQSFDEAYFRHASKKLRVFQGEYGYHIRNFKNYKFLNNGTEYIPLTENDWVIVSLPSCINGNIHSLYKTMMKDAEEKKVPVIIDLAWFNTSYNLNIDVSSSAIESVNFSLSKGLGLGTMRIGIRFSNITDGPIKQLNEYNHLTMPLIQVGLRQMKKFGPDFIPNKYLQSYKKMCNDLGLIETNCMHVVEYEGRLVGVRNLVKKYFEESL